MKPLMTAIVLWMGSMIHANTIQSDSRQPT
jgi:hypothetical protein